MRPGGDMAMAFPGRLDGLLAATAVGVLQLVSQTVAAERPLSAWAVGMESWNFDVPTGTVVGGAGSEPGTRWNSMDARIVGGTVRYISASRPLGFEFTFGGGPREHQVLPLEFLDLGLPDFHEPLANDGSVNLFQSKVLWDPFRWNQVAPFLRAGASLVHGTEHLEYGSFHFDGTPTRRTSTLDREWSSLDVDLDLMVRVYWLEAGLSWGFPLAHSVDWRQDILEPELPPRVRSASEGDPRFGFGIGLLIPLYGLESPAWRSARDSIRTRYRTIPKRNEFAVAVGGGSFHFPWTWERGEPEERSWDLEAMFSHDFEGTGTWGGFASAGLGAAAGSFGTLGWSRNAQVGVWRRFLKDQDFPARLKCGTGVLNQQVRLEGNSTRTFDQYVWKAEAWLLRSEIDILVERTSWFVGFGVVNDLFLGGAHDPVEGGDTGPASLRRRANASFGIDWRLGWKTIF
ncbi:MAG: hypothetical protein H6686_09290 [Fibrobacteria bacterium]|nr:hypothetical protein [Fibrobacteria bacterium]